MFDLNSTALLTYVAGWATISGGFWFLFDRAETVATKKLKLKFSRFLTHANPERTASGIAESISDVFDTVFGPRLFSMRCFIASAGVSIALVGAALLLGLSTHPELLRDTISSLFGKAWWVYWILIAGNIIPDYFSLIETRFVVSRMSKDASILRISFLILLDIWLTAVIATLGVAFLLVLWFMANNFYWYGKPLPPYASVITDFLSDYLLHPINMLKRQSVGVTSSSTNDFAIGTGTWFFPAFFTSVWLWLHALAIFLIKGARHASRILRWLPEYLDISTKPFQSVGYVVFLLVTFCFILAAPLFLL